MIKFTEDIGFINFFWWGVGKESKWSTYLKYLAERKPLNTPAYWSEDARKALSGTSLEERIEGLEEGMKEEFEKLISPFFSEVALKLNDQSMLNFDLFKVSGMDIIL